jgi:hypothetical protein
MTAFNVVLSPSRLVVHPSERVIQVLPAGAVGLDVPHQAIVKVGRSGSRIVVASVEHLEPGAARTGFSFIQDTPPATAIQGQTWYHTGTGEAFVRHDNYWVGY